MPRLPKPAGAAAAFAIKAEFDDLAQTFFALTACKTMYDGKLIRERCDIYLFASGSRGDVGVFAKGVVTEFAPVPPLADVDRQTPRVTVAIRRTAATGRRLGRAELRRFTDWQDGRPETELNFKLYRQATSKIVGVTAATAAYLDGFFAGCAPA